MLFLFFSVCYGVEGGVPHIKIEVDINFEEQIDHNYHVTSCQHQVEVKEIHFYVDLTGYSIEYISRK